MKFKTYRRLDLIILAVLAFGVELMATFAANAFVHGIRPFPVVGMLLTLVAITRWGWRGIIIIPINALANLIIGRFAIVSINYRDTYDFLSYLVSVISTSSILVAFLWFKNKGQKEIFKDKGTLLLMLGSTIIINLILCVLFSSTYYLIDGTSTLSPKSIGARFLGMALYNSFGYVVLILGAFILSSQGVMNDAKQSLIEKKQEKINEDLYYSKKQEEKK